MLSEIAYVCPPVLVYKDDVPLILLVLELTWDIQQNQLTSTQ